MSPIEEVTNEISKSRDLNYIKKLQAILLYLEGRNINEIALEFAISSETVRRWVSRFTQDGINGLKTKKKSGRPTLFNIETENTLLKELMSPPYKVHIEYPYFRWNAQLVTQFTLDKFKIKMSIGTAQRLLDIINFENIDHFNPFLENVDEDSDCTLWAVERYEFGQVKFLPSPGFRYFVGRTLYIHIYIAVSINPEKAIAPQLVCTVTLSKSNHQYNQETYNTFINNMILKCSNGATLVLLLRNKIWEESIAKNCNVNSDTNSKVYLLPSQASHSSHPLFKTMRSFINMLKIEVTTDSEYELDQCRSQIETKCHEVFLEMSSQINDWIDEFYPTQFD